MGMDERDLAERRARLTRGLPAGCWEGDCYIYDEPIVDVDIALKRPYDPASPSVEYERCYIRSGTLSTPLARKTGDQPPDAP